MNAFPDMSTSSRKLNVLQFICSTGFYGAERWVLALTNNSDPSKVQFDLAVTKEQTSENLAVVQKFSGATFTVWRNLRDPDVVSLRSTSNKSASKDYP